MDRTGKVRRYIPRYVLVTGRQDGHLCTDHADGELCPREQEYQAVQKVLDIFRRTCENTGEGDQ